MTSADVAQAYHAARDREGRLLPDDVVRGLPMSGSSTPYATEWRVRSKSMKRLLKDLSRSASPLRVLEIGCGNGWLSARLAEAGHGVTAMDIHTSELEQAKRVFPDLPIAWIDGDPMRVTLTGAFDRIVFAASIQYFADLPLLFERSRAWLNPTGEIHVLDSILYTGTSAVTDAQRRSLTYFTRIGVPQMGPLYHHHLLQDVLALGVVRVLSVPSRWDRSHFPPRLLRDPFHHTVHQFPPG